MPSTQRRGGCHCGTVRYTVDIDLTAPAITCNCSMCGRAGTMLSFVGAGQFSLDQGADNLTDYQFGKQKVHHLFCKTCGVKSFARGDGPHGPMVAVNVRCLDGIELDQVPTTFVDGRST